MDRINQSVLKQGQSFCHSSTLNGQRPLMNGTFGAPLGRSLSYRSAVLPSLPSLRSYNRGEQNHGNTASQGQQQSTNAKVKILINQKGSKTPPPGHPLQDTWIFWFLRLQVNFSWEDSQVQLGSCSTVEKFWGIYNQLVSLSETPAGCNFSIFKRGIHPTWEDPSNRYGGRFVFTIKKDKPDYKEYADKIWFEFSMAVVGNVLPKVCDQICGIIGANRNHMIKIAVWTRDRQKRDEIQEIGKCLLNVVFMII